MILSFRAANKEVATICILLCQVFKFVYSYCARSYNQYIDQHMQFVIHHL